MKQDKHTTLTGTRMTPADVCRWVQTLFHLHTRIAPALLAQNLVAGRWPTCKAF
jgi:hypothetical protein